MLGFTQPPGSPRWFWLVNKSPKVTFLTIEEETWVNLEDLSWEEIDG